jgi:ATP-dependent helicase HrpB
LALLYRLQSRGSNLCIAVMSATLDGPRIASHLGDCPVVRSQGRLFPLDVHYRPHASLPLEHQVRAALESLIAEGLTGSILVFLPGSAEIRRAMRECEPLASRAGLDVLPLHGDLPPEEQDRAVLPGARPKVIFSTNIAESSLTIEGVTAVIDSGLARVAKDSAWTGLPSLEIARISRASAAQRAGRAARTAPGRVVRLYPLEDLVRRHEHDPPEIARRELSRMHVDLAAMRLSPLDIPWLDPPPETAIDAAGRLLQQLGAVDPAGKLTERGLRMARLPLHPRLASLLIDGGTDGCAIAAILGSGERLPPGPPAHTGPSDLLALSESRWSPQTRRLHDQLRRSVRGTRREESEVLKAVLRAFPDRVARRRNRDEMLLAGGGSAVLSESSVVRSEFFVAVDVEERRERGLPLVRMASGIEPAWLLDLFPTRVTESLKVQWNRQAERVESVSALLYDGLVIEESRSGSVEPEAAARLLAAKAVEFGVEKFVEPDEIAGFLNRVRFAARYAGFPELGSGDVSEALSGLCQGLQSFAELRQAAADGGLVRAISRSLTPEQRRSVDVLAPERIRLAAGRAVLVHYEEGKPPWIASRLQDFFGMKDTPLLAGGTVPVVVHLLAPNQRAVQTTTDLAGFWQRLYPRLRKELGRRYPRHSWPENPLAS